MSTSLSIVIPLYNQESFIIHALESIAAQRIEAEVIIIDDMSTDNGLATALTWAKKNAFPLRTHKNATRHYALQCRLQGVAMATAPHILFCDADDIFIGENSLQNLLHFKQENPCDILHFRCKCQTPRHEDQGEFTANAPLPAAPLLGESIFEAYASKFYPPVLLWGKIFSKTLLQKVAPLASKEHIYRFDDKFLCSLCMLYADSYESSDIYAYMYTLSEYWPMEKYAGRVHDLRVMQRVFTKCMQIRNITPKTQEAFLHFIQGRIVNNLGKLCVEIENALRTHKMNSQDLLNRLTIFLSEEELLLTLFTSMSTNANRCLSCARRIRDVF